MSKKIPTKRFDNEEYTNISEKNQWFQPACACIQSIENNQSYFTKMVLSQGNIE